MFETANQLEAVLWWAIGAVFGVCAWRGAGGPRRRCLAAAAVFVLFGFSDLIEIRNWAWWRPWWLLVYKAACVAALAELLVDERRRRRRRGGSPARPESE